ncbi:DUF2608 domain-containing protein [Candidatus Dependentiae bacterium]
MKTMQIKNKRFLGLGMLLVSLVVFLSACMCASKIHKVKNLDLLAKEIKNLNKDSLVIFDVDNTLIVAENGFNNHVSDKFKKVWKPLVKKINNSVKPEKFKVLLSRMSMGTKSMLVDEKVLSIIKEIKNKKSKILALTKYIPGKFGDIDRGDIYRFKTLKSVGIDFGSYFPNYDRIVLKELVHKVKKTSPVFYNGALMTDRFTKGQALKVFLNKIKWWPKKIVYVDDDLKFLQEVKKIAEKKGIEFLGLHYRGAEYIPCNIDPNIAKFQVDNLIKTGQWIGEDQAKKLMEKKKK